MKTTLIASVLALSAIGFSATAFAAGNGNDRMMTEFGAVYSVQVSGHEMHVQAFKDKKTGQEFVVMTREDAEAMMGHKFGAEVVFRDYERAQ